MSSCIDYGTWTSVDGTPIACNGKTLNAIKAIHHVLRQSFIAVTAPNTAKGKATKQSSVYDHGDSSKAVDGNRAATWSQKSCSHTKISADIHWWTVDLTKRYAVTWVVIYNRWESNLYSEFLHKNTICMRAGTLKF